MNEQPLIVVITATTGRETLKDTIESVQNQTYPNIKHIIVCDGKAHQEKVASIITVYKDTVHTIEQITIPWQTGIDMYVCHRIYAAIPHLITEDAYVSFLDDDNYIDPTHYEDLYNAIKETDSEWSYSLRKIVSHTKEYVAHDMCESLGYLSKSHIILYYETVDDVKDKLIPNDPSFYLIDTNCYLLPKTIAQKIAHNWQYPARNNPEADRLLFNDLKLNNYKGICSMKYTVNYRLDSREDSANPKFYLSGNEYMKERHNNEIPWAPL
jgi:glycosyltransferase involved in cell wall biosynthesis